VNLVCGRIIGVGVSYAVGANTLHDAAILAPVLGPVFHVMVARVVNATVLPCTLGLGVDEEDSIRAHELVAFHVADSDLSKDASMPYRLLLLEDVVVVVAELLGEVVAGS
jgi:hypothetical protein